MTTEPDDPREAHALTRLLQVLQAAAEQCIAETGVTAEAVINDLPRRMETNEPTPSLDAATAWLIDALKRADPDDPLLREMGGLTLDATAGLFVHGFIPLLRPSALREVAARRIPHLRLGNGLRRVLLIDEQDVNESRRRIRTRTDYADVAFLSAEFSYDPLGIYETLTLHALVSYARDAGKLHGHAWASSSGAIPAIGDEPVEPQRIRIDYPGSSLIARILGFGASGRVPRETRRAIERAVHTLTNVPRCIPLPIARYPKKGKGRPIDVIEIRKDLWARWAAVAGEGAQIDLYPVAILSHLAAFEDAPDLGAIYDRARAAVGAGQLRDEFGILDSWLRQRAGAEAGKAAAEARKLRKLEPAPEGMTAADDRISLTFKHDTILKKLALTNLKKRRGLPASIERVREAFAFCAYREIGSVIDFTLDDGLMWRATVPHPAARKADPSQFLAFVER